MSLGGEIERECEGHGQRHRERDSEVEGQM